MIKPTVGRVVWFRPLGITGPEHAAIIAMVHSDTCVNLAVFDAKGFPYNRVNVRLLQDGTVPNSIEEAYAEWLPYQKGQAAKTEELEKQISEHKI